MQLLKLFIFFTVFYVSGQISFGKTGMSKFHSEIEETFFENSKLSKRKIENYLADVKEAQEDNYKLLYNYYKVVGEHSDSKAAKKASKKSSSVAYSRLVEVLELLKNAQNKQEAYEIAASAMDIGFSLRTEGRDELYEHEFDSVRGIIRPYKVNKKNMKDPEAFNLLNPSTGKTYTQNELQQMKKTGFDISTLNPKSDGQLWTDHNIESYKVNQTYLPSSNLYKSSDIKFPSDYAEVKFDEIKRSQNRPKFSVTKKIDGVKRKYKVKMELEVHGEPTAAALYSALGFNTDASKYVKGLKVRFKDGEKRQFLKDFKQYFQMFEFRRSVKEEGRDAKGDYVILKGALLEARDDSIVRVGPWGWSSNGNPSKREIRAISLLNVWVGNYDLKESAQNRILLRKGDNPENRYYVSSDLGWVFGSFTEPERPGRWSWNPLLKKWGDSIRFKYYGAKYTKSLSETSWDDARWTIRLMSRLSRTQIEDAVKLGGWPESVGKLLVEKIISRRNILVDVFELGDEIPEIPIDRKITTSDGVVKDGKLKKSTFDGYSKKFGNPLAEILNPTVYGYEESFLANLVNNVTDRVSDYSYSGALFDDYLPWGGRPILRFKRKINRNDEPSGASDGWLVHDRLQIGFQFSTGKGKVSGDGIYYRSFNLIYPVKKQRHGLYSVNYLAAMLLPYAYGYTKMPEKFALLVEDIVEGKGTIRFNSNGFVDLASRTSLSKVVLKRQLFVDKNDSKVNALEDHSAYTELSTQLYTKFANFDFPFFEWLGQRGKIKRDILSTTVPELPSSKDRFNLALSKFFPKNGELGDDVEKRTLKAKYIQRNWGFNLFDYIFTSRKKLKHDIKEYNKLGEKIEERVQIERYVEDKWTMPYLSNRNEHHTGKAFFVGVKTEDGDLEKPVVGLNFKIKDSHTRNGELSKEYVGFANAAANDSDFLPFNAKLFTHRNNWGVTLIFLDFLVYESGIEKLLRVTPQMYEDATGEKYHQGVMSGREKIEADRNLSAEDKALRKMFGNLFKARNSSGNKRARYLTKALRSAIVKTSLNKTFKGSLIGFMTGLLDEEDYFLAAKITYPPYAENILPNQRAIVNQKGVRKYRDYALHRFDLTRSEEVYNFFDTLDKIGSLDPSKDYEW